MNKFSRLQPGIQQKVIAAVSLFSTNYSDSRLHNHAFQGKWRGFRSIDVTGDYRIIFRELSDGTYELVELVDVGTHSQLYG